MGKILAVLSLIVASLVGFADPVAASECAGDPAGDANVAAGAASLAGQALPDIGISDASADFTTVCVAIGDAVTVTFEVASDASAESVARNFSAFLPNGGDCYTLTVTYERGADGDSGRASASTPSGCEPPPWFFLLDFDHPVSGVEVSHTAGTNQYVVSVPTDEISAVVDPYLGYWGSPSFYLDEATSSFATPVGPVLDRVSGEGP